LQSSAGAAPRDSAALDGAWIGLAGPRQIGKACKLVLRPAHLTAANAFQSIYGAMTLLANLQGSSAVQIIRYADVDHFKVIERLVTARSVPTDLSDFAASLAILTLPSCTIFLQRTFPRIVEADFHTEGALVGLPMEDAATVTLNGVYAPGDTLLLARGKGPSDLVEARANLFALIMFNSPMRDRGWPEVENETRIVRPNPGSLRGLQAVVREIFLFGGSSAQEFAMPSVACGLDESLVAAVDRALADCEPAISLKQAAARDKYLRMVRQLDDALSHNLGATFYSHELARKLGISVRTLHNAVVTIRGRPLHDYIRLRRLWCVHQSLASGAPSQIKAVALANGFWHPGEFSQSYRSLFGETPSQTLVRARHG
jgi:AraC family ethanolamine operon transcriptional activator